MNKFNSYLASLAVLVCIVLLNSCSTQNPVAFGNRKFYPEGATNTASSHVTKPAAVISQDQMRITQEVANQLAIDQTSSTEKPTVVERVESAKKAIAKVLTEKPKLSLREKIALKLVSKSIHAGGTKAVDGDKKTPGSAIAGFILGILSIFIAGIILGVAAVIFSAVALSKPNSEYRNGLAIVGLILGIIGIIGALIVISQM